MTKLKLPPGCKWIDETEQHVGKVICMIPAEVRDGKLFPGLVQEFKIDDVEAMREWLKRSD